MPKAAKHAPVAPASYPATAQLSVGQWGNALAMRLNKDIERMLDLRPGDKFNAVLESRQGVPTITLQPQVVRTKPSYTLAEMLQLCDAHQRPDDAWAGLQPAGREVLA